MKRILIMGLSGTGKTTFAEQLRKELSALNKTVLWYNADNIRERYNDWDFSYEGRIRQAKRMKQLADISVSDYVICDFVAPFQEMRDIFDADYIIWMDTEKSSSYKDTDNIFEKPKNANYIITSKDNNMLVPYVIKDIFKLKMVKP